MSLLDASDYDAIRAAIDLSVDAATLPDAVIALPTYQTAAELAVLARDPAAATRTGDAATQVRNAAVWLCAALLCPIVPRLTGEQYDSDYRYTREAFVPAVRAAELRALADTAISAVLEPATPSSSAARPTMFALASGRRGR